jgi:sugar lactone lactonase YvrE
MVGLPLVPGVDCPDEGPSESSGLAAAQWLSFNGVTALAVDPDGRLHWLELGLPWRLEDDATVHLVGEVLRNDAGRMALAPDGNEVDAFTFDVTGRMVFVDTAAHVVRRIEADGTMTTLAGTGAFDFSAAAIDDDGALATSVDVDPRGVAVDGLGRVFVLAGARVRRIELDGTFTTVAGSATDSDGPRADGGPARLAAFFPVQRSLVVDAQGNAFFLTQFGGTSQLRRVDAGGTLTTVVGAVHPAGPGPFASAKLYASRALAALPDERLVSVGDFGRALALDLAEEQVDVVTGYPEGSPAAAAQARFAPLFDDARGVAFDPVAHALVITEHGAGSLRVVDVDADDDGAVDDADRWTSATVATELSGPAGIAYDATTQTFVVVDEAAACVRRLARDGTAGAVLVGRCGAPGSFDGQLDGPTHVAVSPSTGAVYVSDTGNHRVVRAQGDVVAVVVGDGSVSSAGEGRPARRFPVNAPGQLALDAHGNLFVTSTTTVRLVANVDGDADADGDDAVVTVYGGDARTAFPESDSRCLQALALVGDDVYVADACQGFVLRVQPLLR